MALPPTGTNCSHFSVDGTTWLEALTKVVKSPTNASPSEHLSLPRPPSLREHTEGRVSPLPPAQVSCSFCGSVLAENQVCDFCGTVGYSVHSFSNDMSE